MPKIQEYIIQIFCEQAIENVRADFSRKPIQPVELHSGKGPGQLEQLHAALARHL